MLAGGRAGVGVGLGGGVRRGVGFEVGRDVGRVVGPVDGVAVATGVGSRWADPVGIVGDALQAGEHGEVGA